MKSIINKLIINAISDIMQVSDYVKVIPSCPACPWYRGLLLCFLSALWWRCTHSLQDELSAAGFSSGLEGIFQAPVQVVCCLLQHLWCFHHKRHKRSGDSNQSVHTWLFSTAQPVQPQLQTLAAAKASESANHNSSVHPWQHGATVRLLS